MRIVFSLVIALLISSVHLFGQSEEPTIANSILKRAMETSYYSNQVNWEAVSKEYLALAEGKETVEELKPALQYLINSLGDKHGGFRSASNYSLVVYYTGPVEGVDNRDANFVHTVINDVTAAFSYELLPDNTGYLKVVGIGPDKTIEEHAQIIRNGVKDLKSQGADKWILDLRYNGGGNMNPMIAGLAPLIGEGFIGGSVDANGDLLRSYEIKDGDFYDTENLVAPIGPEPRINPSEKVAVLLSRYTISSGELVAVAFKERPNTLFIGESTAGYTTANGWDPVSDELIMVISQAVYVDRTNNRYDDRVGVDVEIEFVPTENKREDLQVLKALDWLNE